MEQKINIKLMHDSFTEEELQAVIDCFRSGEYTQGRLVREFEYKFAQWTGAQYAIMVNSGSSANLLMVMLLKEKFGLHDGDEVIVPAVTWPTTVYPLLQYHLTPVFCDVDESFNLSIESMRKMLGQRTKAVCVVHLLGQPANMAEIVRFCNENNLMLIEDCCESLGARYLNIHVGNFGVMGSFSFYYGHHMSSIEGGMVITQREDICDLLKSARSHGWVRDSLRAEKYAHEYKNLNFVFDMMGYNVRSTNMNAAIALVQLKKLDAAIRVRRENHKLFSELLKDSTRIKLQRVNFFETSSFSLGILVDSKENRDFLLAYLPSKGIECRPIVAGNLLQQPVFKKMKEKYQRDACAFADSIHERGLYLPNNQFIDEEKVRTMARTVKEYGEHIRIEQQRSV